MWKAYIYIGLLTIAIISCREPVKETKRPVPPKQPVKKQLEYLLYGLQRGIDRKNAEAMVADRWGFKFKTVAGCLVTKALTDSVDIHNSRVDYLLAKKHGKNWRVRFEKAVDAEIITDKKIFKLLDNDNRNKKKQAEVTKLGFGLYYILQATADPQRYTASAESLKRHNGEDRLVSFYRYDVDLSTSIVRLLSDTLIFH